jgi:hypothetical protein
MDRAVYPVWYLLQGGQVSGRIQSGTSQQMNAMAHDGCGRRCKAAVACSCLGEYRLSAVLPFTRPYLPKQWW